MTPIAALYVETNGVYFGTEGVDPWDAKRDARRYAGPHPVVAHPPCQRWGRYWSGGPNPKAKRYSVPGMDGGLFAAAFASVNLWGGVLEHPEASHAWARFSIPRPPSAGGWVRVPWSKVGWTCQVEQGHYGHRCRKKTWLYYAGDTPPPALMWGRSEATGRLEPGYHSADEARAARSAPGYVPAKRPTKRENEATPREFAELLIGIARSVWQSDVAPRGTP